MSTADDPRTSSTRWAPALCASALILAGLLAVQLGRLTAPGTPSAPDAAARARSLASLFEGRTMAAAADVVSQSGPYTVLTFNGGNEDILVVLDNRAEDVFMYMIHNQSRLDYLGRESLRQMFTDARGGGAGAGGRR